MAARDCAAGAAAHLVVIFVPVSVGCSALAIVALCFYRIDRAIHEHNLDRLRDAAALAEMGEAEAPGIAPFGRAV